MTFTVHCSGCNAAFPIDSAKVPFPGVYAECSECSSVFLVRPPEEDTTDLSHGAAAYEYEVDADPEDVPVPQYETLPAEPHPTEPSYEPEPSPAFDELADVEFSSETDMTPEHDFPELPELDSYPVSEAEPELPAVEFSEPAPLTAEPAPEAEVMPEPTPEPEPEPAPAPTTSPFGRRDPHERARRLARVLVSDMIAYYPDRHRQSLRAGSLAKDFEEEIEKSWSEYVDQVGRDIADETTYFKDALNDVLAEGNEVF